MGALRGFSIVIPVLNEAASLDILIDRLLRTCGFIGLAFEIIFVDDGSNDGSREKLRAAVNRRHGQIVALFLDRNYGQHAALFAGFRHTHGDVIVTIDADLQNPPEEIPRLLQKVEEGFDVVGTVRRLRQDSLFRRLASDVMNRVSSAVSGVTMRDYGCMLRAYRRNVVEAMLSHARERAFIPVLANYFAARPCEIAVDHAPRRSGESRYNLWKLAGLQTDLLLGRPRRPTPGAETQAGPRYVIQEILGESLLEKG